MLVMKVEDGGSETEGEGKSQRKESAKSATAKPSPAAEKTGSQKSSAPKISRPQIPAVYGIPKHNKGLLPWSHVSERMAEARVYWITTVDPSGRPHGGSSSR
jgi:hypothetical protein